MTPEEYDAWYETDRGQGIGDTEYRLLDDLLALREGERLLDVGCGTGWFTRRFAALTGVAVTGIDIDRKALAFAREHDPRSSYVMADATCLPFAEGSFHKVLSVTALGFVPDWPQALSEIVRVASDRFVVGVLNRHSLLWVQKGRGGGHGAYRGAHWHTAQELLRALADRPVWDIQVRTAVWWPSGSQLARRVERSWAQQLPFGGFLAVAGRKRTQKS